MFVLSFRYSHSGKHDKRIDSTREHAHVADEYLFVPDDTTPDTLSLILTEAYVAFEIGWLGWLVG